MAIEVGLGLVKIVDSGQGGSLLKRIAGVRRQLAAELGFVLPPVRVTDNLSLKPREYVVLLKGAEIARFELQPESTLAILPQASDKRIEGVPCEEPAFGLPALWVPQQQADKARLLGYTVVDPANVVATHLAELIRRHAHELMSRQAAQELLDRVRDEHPKLVEDLVPKLLPLSLLQRVLQNLLRERASIRDAVTVLEALAEASAATKNPTLLTEFVRQALSRSLVRPYLNDRGELAAYLLDPALERDHPRCHRAQRAGLTAEPVARDAERFRPASPPRRGRAQRADAAAVLDRRAVRGPPDSRDRSAAAGRALARRAAAQRPHRLAGGRQMKLKTYRVERIETALRLAKVELGADAAIVDSKPEDGKLAVTFAVERRRLAPGALARVPVRGAAGRAGLDSPSARSARRRRGCPGRPGPRTRPRTRA